MHGVECPADDGSPGGPSSEPSADARLHLAEDERAGTLVSEFGGLAHFFTSRDRRVCERKRLRSSWPHRTWRPTWSTVKWLPYGVRSARGVRWDPRQRWHHYPPGTRCRYSGTVLQSFTEHAAWWLQACHSLSRSMYLALVCRALAGPSATTITFTFEVEGVGAARSASICTDSVLFSCYRPPLLVTGRGAVGLFAAGSSRQRGSRGRVAKETSSQRKKALSVAFPAPPCSLCMIWPLQESACITV